VKRIAAACAILAMAAGASSAERLTLATWNTEWLMTPETFDALAASCLDPARRAAGNERAIPCDLVSRGRWSDDDLERLRAFAATLDADVVALQEIDGVPAARRIFADRAFCFTRRRHVQNVGFAIRKGIPFRCNRDVRALGLPEDDVRWGADVTLHPGTERELRLLAVHLKSSCNRDPLTSSRPDCGVLQRQVPVLEDWIDRRARDGSDFGVVGDFNRRFDRERTAARDESGAIVALWPEIDDGDPEGADLVDPGADRGPLACGNGRPARMPVDYLILGRRLADRLVPGSYRVHAYPAGGRWPDHCVISIELDLQES
jgi:endonuclease/exonuclease/phosphatase family metal-dependent hydrolase